MSRLSSVNPSSPVHIGNKVEFNTVDFVEPATDRQQSWTFNVVVGLFGNNLNIYESRDDPATSDVISIKWQTEMWFLHQFQQL